jgi:hypothetical protein
LNGFNIAGIGSKVLTTVSGLSQSVRYGFHSQGGLLKAYLFNDFPTLESWKAYLASQYSIYKPVTVYYRLAKPIVINLTPIQMHTYYPCTYITTDSTVKADITVTVKTAELQH